MIIFFYFHLLFPYWVSTFSTSIVYGAFWKDNNYKTTLLSIFDLMLVYQKSGDDKDKVRKQRQIVVSHQKSGDDKALVGHGVLAHCLVTALLNSRKNISSGIFNISRMKGL